MTTTSPHEVFRSTGLWLGRHFGSKSGYARRFPGAIYIPDAAVFTLDCVKIWGGDLDLKPDAGSLLEASRLLRRKLLILPEQEPLNQLRRKWMWHECLATVWRGELALRPVLYRYLSEAQLKSVFISRSAPPPEGGPQLGR